jgi:hypothetical protein
MELLGPREFDSGHIFGSDVTLDGSLLAAVEGSFLMLWDLRLGKGVAVKASDPGQCRTAFFCIVVVAM